MGDAAARRARPDPVAVGVFVVALGVYWLFPNRIYTGDGIDYATFIEQGRNLFSPHHLLYNATGYAVYQLVRPLGVARALPLLGYLSGLMAAGGLAFFYLALKPVAAGVRWLALAGTALLALSYGWWFYSVTPEVYPFPFFFMLLSLWLVLRQPQGKAPPPSLAWPLGLVSALACLYHQQQIFVIPGLLLVLRWRNGASLRFLAAYLLSAGVLVATVYGAVAASLGVLTSPAAFYHWLTHFAQQGLWGDGLAWRSLPVVAATLARTVYALPKALLDGSAGTLLAVAAGAVFGLAALALLWSQRRHIVPAVRSEPAIVAAAALWAIIYTGFTLWWRPENVELQLPWLAPLWLVFVLVLRARPGGRDVRPVLLGLMLAALVVNNFAGRILPGSRLANNLGYQASVQMQPHLRAGDLVIAEVFDWYLHLRYFYGMELPTLEGLKRWRDRSPAANAQAAAQLQAAIDDALQRGQRVITLEVDEREPALLRAARNPAFTQAEVEAFYSRYRLEPLFALPGEQGPYRAYQILGK